MPLDRRQKLSWFVGLPLAVATVATIVVVHGAPSGAPHRPTGRTAHAYDPLERNLRAIYRGVRFHLLQYGELPRPSSAITPPLDTCCDHPDRTCAPSPTQWEHEPWPSIGFEVVDADPYSYSYTLESPGDRFTIRGIGDPDCDGASTMRKIEGVLVGDALDPDPVILP